MEHTVSKWGWPAIRSQKSYPTASPGAQTVPYTSCTQQHTHFLPWHRSKAERRKNFIGDQLEECKDLSGLYYVLPFQRGYLVNWDTQRQVWDYVLGPDVMSLQSDTHSLVISEPLYNFHSIQDTMNEIFFEEYKFSSLLRLPASSYSSFLYQQAHPSSLCCLVVDTGYSFTHIVPYYRGKIVEKGVKRIDVGGKLLTNYLKEIVSYRQLHVMEETYVMNQVKEDSCYVSQDFLGDMEQARKRGNSIVREYVLPDFTTRRRGFVREVSAKSQPQQQQCEEQCLKLANERFSIPEILFHPSNIGIEQMGIPEAIAHSISLTPSPMHPHLYANIIVTGGNALFPGFEARISSEVRKMAPDDFEVNVTVPEAPPSYAWLGGATLASASSKPGHLVPVTLSEYKEHGHSLCYSRFNRMQVWTPTTQ